MRSTPLLALVLLGGCAVSARPSAVPEPEQASILVAALHALRASIPGDLVVDPRIAAYDARPGQSWAGGTWPRAQAESFAAVLRGRVAELGSVRECHNPWRGRTLHEMGCVMEGADVHLALSRPLASGSGAAVLVYVNADWRSAARDESVRVVRVELGRSAGGWEVTDTRVLAAM